MRYRAALVAVALMMTSIAAERVVFENEKFLYRIELETGWVAELANDSEIYLKDSSPGKKTRLHIKRYSVDTMYDFTTMDWSRYSFAVNKGFAEGTGKVVFSDTGSGKKLGALRAFELFSFFSQMVNGSVVWWAEYSRWTDDNGTGFLVSFVGDTAEIKNRYTWCKSVMDSMILKSPESALTITHPGFKTARVPRYFISSGYTDLLGRNNGVIKAGNCWYIDVKSKRKTVLWRSVMKKRTD